MKVTIYHNFKCSKSQKTLEILKQQVTNKDIELEVIDYLLTPPNKQQLKAFAIKMNLSIRDLIRTNEYEYAQLNLADKHLNDDDLLSAMNKHPILIERPIVHSSKGTIIGRPPENVLSILP